MGMSYKKGPISYSTLFCLKPLADQFQLLSNNQPLQNLRKRNDKKEIKVYEMFFSFFYITFYNLNFIFYIAINS